MEKKLCTIQLLLKMKKRGWVWVCWKGKLFVSLFRSIRIGLLCMVWVWQLSMCNKSFGGFLLHHFNKIETWGSRNKCPMWEALKIFLFFHMIYLYKMNVWTDIILIAQNIMILYCLTKKWWINLLKEYKSQIILQSF